MMTMGRYCYAEVLPFAAMVMVECTNVGLSTIFKAAASKGLSSFVFMVYSYAISTLVLIPLSYLFHRKTLLPPFTISLLGRFFLLGSLGFSAQLIGYIGIDYASPTLASAMSNLTPACTFVLAILFGMEKLVLRRLSSQAKIIGTLVSIAGAFVVVLYKGPMLIRTSTSSFPASEIVSSTPSDWALGGALLAAEYIIVSIWYIFQAKTVKEYPAELLVVFFYSLCCFIISTPVCLIMQPNMSAWKITTDVGLAAVLYAGIIGSSFGTVIHTWGLHLKGPVYVALFRPLSIAIAAIMGVIVLGDSLYLGCVLGAILISIGFYAVIWGKSQENISGEAMSTENAPLLQGYRHSKEQEQKYIGAA